MTHSERTVPSQHELFSSFFLGGFECSTHRTREGRRLDLLAATGHDRHARADYLRLQHAGIRAARDGVRWHLVEQSPGCYDWGSVLPMVRAARETGTQVIWDLCHYGYPDDLDLLSPAFMTRLAAFARAFARLLVSEGETVPFLAPMNEISFFSWAGGEIGWIFPGDVNRGLEYKAQMVRATVAAIEAIWEAAPGARIVHPDPAIHVHADPGADAYHQKMAYGYSCSMLEAWDFISGRLCPELGGKPEYLDIVGVNYYPHNQWVFRDVPYSPDVVIRRDHPQYRPFHHILKDVYARYGRPVFLAETGSDGDDRAAWLRYVCGEVRAAITAGVPIEGICLYPIVNFPWWDDDDHLHNGLWDYPPDARGGREIYAPLADELARQQHLFREVLPPPV